MSDLREFSRRIGAEFAEAERTNPPAYAAEQMAKFEARLACYEQRAHHFIDGVVRPRVEKVASYYPNASLGRRKKDLRCELWLGYMEHFPANARIEFNVFHDDDVTSLVFSYESHIVPAFIKYDRFDRLVVPLDLDGDDGVAVWVESCLLRFVRASLAVRQGGIKGEEVLVADPVCGMRVPKSTTTPHSEYLGHPYFFCGTNCRDRFGKEPLRYVVVTTDY
ncbi:MAG: YHS domain-containing protein [Pirellulales bacterium]